MVYMYHSFLILSSADGHLGCFDVPQARLLRRGACVHLCRLTSLLSVSRGVCVLPLAPWAQPLLAGLLWALSVPQVRHFDVATFHELLMG